MLAASWRVGRLSTLVVSTLVVLALLALPTAASAQTSPEVMGPWDGRNPFRCELQQLGTGTEYPHPEADPLCVEFDKTNQNVTDFGLVEFLSLEPARVAAASPKCFYYQRDHWTGSIQQGEEPEAWHWDGNYFFDKAKGIGGVSVRNFRIGGVPQDGSEYAPPQYRPFFYPGGGGGAIVELESEPDPTCRAMVDTPRERRRVYRDEPVFPRCVPPGGQLRRRTVGRVRLGMGRAAAWRTLGGPRWTHRGTDGWCVTGGASLRLRYRADSAAAARRTRTRRVALIWTTSRGHEVRGISRGTRVRRARRRLDLVRRFKMGRTRVFEVPRRPGRRVFLGARGGRVRWLAVADPRRLRGERSIRRNLRRTRRPAASS
jgi:hypothetical protein